MQVFNNSIRSKVIFLGIIILFLKVCSIYFGHLLFAIFISLLLQPFIEILRKLNVNKTTAIVLVYSIFILLMFFVIKFLVSYVYEVVVNLSNDFSYYASNFQILNEKFNNAINLGNVINYIKVTLDMFKDKILNLVLTALNSFANVFLIILISFIINYDFEKIKEYLKTFMPDDLQIAFYKTYIYLKSMIFIQLQLVVISLFFMTVCFHLLGFKEAFLYGFFCGVLDILPILGPALFFIPLIIYKFILNEKILAIGLILTYVINIMIRQILEVKLINMKLKISPLAIILVLYFGWIIFGWIGIFVSPILYLLSLEIFTKDNLFSKGVYSK
ncbi:Predicted PurR-regulated permease PerM [Caloramator fervidus]|uniref:Predicted PurR-regulated permease PerM n=1 Tax=Caloramator fervidus TaxID=29344 RepID=A0A1H5S462_9CLOT|nr:AI-2E family transporter [Caloramator fervidus]SEF45392.1 Predicted PurR-regulated permease PerM [Caloramator fervidus]